MKIRIITIAVTMLPLMFLMSCKKDSGDSSGDEFPQEMRDVWQEEGWGDGDELGIYFTKNTIGFWDYMGDEYDNGEDCYSNSEYVELISYEGDNFRLRQNSDFSDTQEEATVKITVNGNTLMMSYPDDGNGDYTEEYSRDSRDLTPECGGSFKVNPEKMKQKINRILAN